MKNSFIFFFVLFAIVFLSGCSSPLINEITPINQRSIDEVEKLINEVREVASSTNNSDKLVDSQKATETQFIVSDEKPISKLDAVIAALNGKHLKDLYRELYASSSPSVDWGVIGRIFDKSEEEVKKTIPADSSDIDWHAIGLLLLATSSIDCEGLVDTEHYVTAAPLISIADAKADFINNVSHSLALKKYEECWLKYFDRAQEIGLPARAAFYEGLALTLGSEFTVGAAALYNVFEHKDWCTISELDREKQDYCLNLKEEEVILKMRKYYQITDAITEIKKQYAEWFDKTTGTTTTSEYGDEEDSDEYAKKKLAAMGGMIRTERSMEAGEDAQRAGSSSEIFFKDEYFNQSVRITVITLREHMGWMGILDNLDEKIYFALSNLSDNTVFYFQEILKDKPGIRISSLNNASSSVSSFKVHPTKGVRFSLSGKIDLKSDLVLTSAQFNEMLKDFNTKIYTWGVGGETAQPIELTGKEYFKKYISVVGEIHSGSFLSKGTPPLGLAEAYPKGYYFEHTGANSQKLWLVFEGYKGGWYLVGIING